MAAGEGLPAFPTSTQRRVGIGVAVVGADAHAQAVMGQLFKGTGEFWPCGFFPTAAAALGAIPSLGGVHLVLVETVLPDGCGIRCAMELRARRPELKTILMTTLRAGVLLQRAFGAGISDALVEPFSLGQCFTALSLVSCRIGGAWRPDAPVKAPSGIAPGAGSAAEAAEALTEREEAVLALLAEGYPYKWIEDRLHLSHTALRKAQHSAYQKLHVQTRADAVRRWYQLKRARLKG